VDALMALAIRLIAPRQGVMGESARDPRLLVGAIPSPLPAEVPLPDDARVLGSLAADSSTSIILDTDWPITRVLDFYRERLLAAGWTVSEHMRPQGGFAHSSGSNLTHIQFCLGDPGPGLTVTAVESEGQPTQVEVGIATYEDHPDRSPCAQRWRHRPRELIWEVLPALVPPAGAAQQARGGGSSDNEVRSFARLDTTLDTAAVATHYTAQLEHANWTRTGEGATGPVAWSTWSLADGEGNPWRGLFVAIRRDDTPGRYALVLDAERIEGRDGSRSGSSVATGWTHYGPGSSRSRPTS
jgi:hypothetical protein